jgi:hypothetical protein
VIHERKFLRKAGGRPLLPIMGCWQDLIAWLILALTGARSPTDYNPADWIGCWPGVGVREGMANECFLAAPLIKVLLAATVRLAVTSTAE